MRAYKKCTITQVRKEIRDLGKFSGFAVGNKVNTGNFFSNWRLAVECQFTTLEGLEKYNNAMLARLDKQLGNRIAWYKFV